MCDFSDVAESKSSQVKSSQVKITVLAFCKCISHRDHKQALACLLGTTPERSNSKGGSTALVTTGGISISPRAQMAGSDAACWDGLSLLCSAALSLVILLEMRKESFWSPVSSD